MARPTTPKLDKELIRDAALTLIDEAGMDGLSMRALGDRLGVRAQSLYTHFPNKEAILDSIANLLTQSVDTTGFDGGDWREGLRAWGRSYRGALMRHPNAAAVITAGTRDRADFLAMADAVHGGLLEGGWPPRQATLISASVKYLVVGAYTTPFASGFADDTTVYLNRYPNLSSAHRIRSHAEEIDNESFELALDALIHGLEQHHPNPG